MSTEKKLMMVEQACEFAIGVTVAAVVHGIANPKGAVAKTLIGVGGTALAFVAGRKFGKEFAELCDQVFDTDLKNHIV
jgi:hypothetical protein